MKLQKFRWSKVYESNEEELTTLLQARGIKAVRRTVEAFDDTGQKTVDQITTIWCAEGSLTFNMGATAIPMQAGDFLRIPEQTPFSITAGMVGYVLYEA